MSDVRCQMSVIWPQMNADKRGSGKSDPRITRNHEIHELKAVEMMMSLRVVARIKAKPDKVEEVRDALTGLVAPTRNEQGCIVYELLQNTEDATDFTFVEEWESEGALAKHAASEHIKATRAKLDGIVDGAIDIRTYNLIK